LGGVLESQKDFNCREEKKREEKERGKGGKGHLLRHVWPPWKRKKREKSGSSLKGKGKRREKEARSISCFPRRSGRYQGGKKKNRKGQPARRKRGERKNRLPWAPGARGGEGKKVENSCSWYRIRGKGRPVRIYYFTRPRKKKKKKKKVR